MIAVDNVGDVVDALTRGAPAAYAAEFGGAYDPAKVFYVCTKETWAAVIAAILRGYPHGVPAEVSAMKLAFNAAMPLGRFDVGYLDHPGTVVPVEIEIPTLSFGDRARVDLVDAIRGVIPSTPTPGDIDAVVVTASPMTWRLLFNADPRLDDTALPPRCLGCVAKQDASLADGSFVVSTPGAAPRVVTIALT